MSASSNFTNKETRRGHSTAHRRNLCMLAMFALLSLGCNVDERRSGLPSEAQAAIDKVTEDIAQGRYEKIYHESAEEWRRTVTPEQSKVILDRVRNNLGKVESRSFVSGREQQKESGDLPGHTLIVSYNTTFERAKGMETFTLVKRDGRWMLARYFVNSDALK